jgi:hypothetical protein
MEYQSQTKTCQNCKKDFTVESDDFLFYEKIKVTPPTFCPECRLIRRLIMRNERTLYKRNCDLCEESKIFIYPKDSKFKVYCRECFHGDGWDAETYSLDFDFSKKFFNQLIDLYEIVPKPGVIKQGFIINSEYTNRVTDLKNCYLVFSSADCEDCLYGWSNWDSKNCIDCSNIIKCERCYWCTDCTNSNNLKYSRECNSCIDSFFLLNCRNCQNCFGCTNLRNKNYCIFNKQYSKEEYFKKLEEYNLSNRDNLNSLKIETEKLFNTTIVPYMLKVKSIDSSGNWVDNSKNTKYSFGCGNVENGKYLFCIRGAKDVMDYTYWGKSSELMYEVCSAGIQCSSMFFCNESWNANSNLEYCYNCFSCNYCFGCVGLNKKEYFILNKKYSREEYFKMVGKIKKQMVENIFIDNIGREIKYGEFFPSNMTPFCYNETIANEYFPKNVNEAKESGFRWKSKEIKNYVPDIKGCDLPKEIKSVEDSILNKVIECDHKEKCNHGCTMAFKITKDELQFYKQNKIPLPVLCHNCRYYERISKRNPLKLWHRKCIKYGCNNEFETSYAPERPEIVYCEKCYQQEVY